MSQRSGRLHLNHNCLQRTEQNHPWQGLKATLAIAEFIAKIGGNAVSGDCGLSILA
ncbi:hypothetical protein [Synechococcus sp. PCC 7336]|uniref:hypothetical protein n=1 Tax=Synechococcus sp. PCC 7336 TaxID=195250 RepID=UPI00034847D6|nr:hypothetical protein [Synechococcus sp. PCC 7336]